MDVNGLLAEGDRLRNYVKEVMGKTVSGLEIQKKILKGIAKQNGFKYKKSTAKQDGIGIDGWVGDESYSVKPKSFQISGGGSTLAAQHHVYYDFNETGQLQYKVYDNVNMTA